ncbi:MAG: hypothetical protein ACRDYZ_08720, partial [Acidimicrobiales bacterium]
PWGGQQGQPAQPPAQPFQSQPPAQPPAQPWGGPEQPRSSQPPWHESVPDEPQLIWGRPAPSEAQEQGEPWRVEAPAGELEQHRTEVRSARMGTAQDGFELDPELDPEIHPELDPELHPEIDPELHDFGWEPSAPPAASENDHEPRPVRRGPGRAGAQGAPGGAQPLGDLLRGEDPVTGLLPLGALLGRTGRLLGAAGAGGGLLAMVVVELAGDAVEDDVLLLAAHAIRGQLRFDDPVARVGDAVFAAAVPLAPGTSTGTALEDHVGQAVSSAIASDDVEVRVAHVVAQLDDRRDADELLRSALEQLCAQ